MGAMIIASLLVWLQESRPAPRLWSEDLEGRTGELASTDLPLDDPRLKGVWIIRPEGFLLPAAESRAGGTEVRLTLANGDVLGGRVRGGAGEELELELVAGVVIPVGLDDLRSLVVPARVPESTWATLEPPREGDRLVRVSGELEPIDGTVEGFSAEGLRFDSVLGSRTMPWSEVGALFVESLSEVRAPTGDEVPVQVSLGGPAGGRVRGGLLRLERESCRIKLGGRTEVDLPLGAVTEILVADGRLAYLSDLPAEEVGRGAPFGDELGMVWPHRRDRCVQGTELQAAGQVHARGLGVHAPSRLTFVLDPPGRALRGSVAIDDSARVNPPAARGSVVFRVLGDGKTLWESPLMRGGDAPLALPPLDLTGVRELVLEADPHGDFAGDRADWLALRLVR